MHILWLDIETNGGEPDKDGYMLEIGAVLTDLSPEFKVRTEMTSLVFRPSLVGSTGKVDTEALFAAMPKVVQDMHKANGLWGEWAAMANGNSMTRIERSEFAVESRLLGMVNNYASHRNNIEKVAIAGSGVAHFDMRFLRVFMPSLVKRCEYYQYDTGPVRRFIKAANRDDLLPKAANAKIKTHRALDDARQHAEEGRAYATMFARIPTPQK